MDYFPKDLRIGWHKMAQVFCYLPGTKDFGLKHLIFTKSEMEYLAEWCVSQTLDPLFYGIAKMYQRLNMLNQKTRNSLRKTYFNNCRINRKRIKEIAYLNRLFTEAQIPFVFLKEYGYDRTYPNPGYVSQVDIDILVKEEHIYKVFKIFKKNGYHYESSKTGNEFTFCKKDSSPIDLHRDFISHDTSYISYKSDYETIFRSVRAFKINDFYIPVLHPVDNMIYQLIHLTIHHNFIPFSKLVNCWNSFIANANQVDWHRFAQRLKSMHINNLGWLSIDYMQKIVGHILEVDRHLKKPDCFSRFLFKMMMPKPSKYFHEKSLERLQKSHSGTHFCLYLDTARQRFNFFLYIFKNLKQSIYYLCRKRKYFKLFKNGKVE